MAYKTSAGLSVTFDPANLERYYAQEAERRGFTASTMNALRDAARGGTLSAGQKTTASEIIGQAILAAMDWT